MKREESSLFSLFSLQALALLSLQAAPLSESGFSPLLFSHCLRCTAAPPATHRPGREQSLAVVAAALLLLRGLLAFDDRQPSQHPLRRRRRLPTSRGVSSTLTSPRRHKRKQHRLRRECLARSRPSRRAPRTLREHRLRPPSVPTTTTHNLSSSSPPRTSCSLRACSDPSQTGPSRCTPRTSSGARAARGQSVR